MSFVATLIADPAAPRLTQELAETARRAIAAAGAEAGAPDWLCPRIACDLAFSGDAAAVRARLAAAFAGQRVDIVVQAAAGRRKKLLVADMESTIIANEMVDDLAEMLGIGPQVAAITARAMNGELAFQPALRERVALLGGLEVEALERARERIAFNPGAFALVATMRAHGAFAALVSGGFRVFTRWVAARAGFDRDYANELLIEGGVVSGRIAEPILGREAKRQALEALCAERGLGLADAIAVGDGANDMAMLAAAGLGVAYRAKPAVAAAAPVRIDHGDLTALLYAQGYRHTEFKNGAN